METIKVIDLLVENSKGNHPDFRFKKRKNMIWKWDGCYYLCGASELDATFRVLGQLNEEVEIIEDTPKEDKKIEKMKNFTFDEMISKISEIIEVINERNI